MEGFFKTAPEVTVNLFRREPDPVVEAARAGKLVGRLTRDGREILLRQNGPATEENGGLCISFVEAGPE